MKKNGKENLTLTMEDCADSDCRHFHSCMLYNAFTIFDGLVSLRFKGKACPYMEEEKGRKEDEEGIATDEREGQVIGGDTMKTSKEKRIVLRHRDCIDKYICDHWETCILNNLFDPFVDLKSIHFEKEGCHGMVEKREHDEWWENLTDEQREKWDKTFDEMKE